MTDATTLIGKPFDSQEVQAFTKEFKAKPKVDKDVDRIFYIFKRAGVSLRAEPRSTRINSIFFYADTYSGKLPKKVEFSMTMDSVEKLLGKPESRYDDEYEHSLTWNFDAYQLFVEFDPKGEMTSVTVSGA